MDLWGQFAGATGSIYQDLYDHPEDSILWLRLLELADKAAGAELVAILTYVRGGGAVLVKSREYGYRIEPVIGAKGWPSQEVYNVERGQMIRYKTQIMACLRQL